MNTYVGTGQGKLKQNSKFCHICGPSGLPSTGSWQDLKDHMREAGDVCFADVQRDGEGVVEFLRREDMEYALRRLDRTEFRSHQVSNNVHYSEMCQILKSHNGGVHMETFSSSPFVG